MKKYIALVVLTYFIANTIFAQNKATDVRSIAIKTSKVNRIISKVGTVFASKSVMISSLNGGLVEKLFLEEGQEVKKNKVLAHIGTIDSKLNLNDARNLLSQQKINLEYTKKNWERQKEFYKKGIINLAQFEQIENQYKLAQIREKSAKLGERRARIHYNRAIIKTPISGVVDKKFFEVGEFVGPGKTVYQIFNDTKLKINFSINENELQDFQIGQSGKIYFDALAGKYTGAIQKISPSANTQTKTFQIEMVLNNENKKIRPGITARMEIEILKEGEHILIPLEAIIESSQGKLVFLNKNGVAKEAPISTGENVNSQVLVTSGLQIEDRLIIKGQQFLNDNDPINDLAQ